MFKIMRTIQQYIKWMKLCQQLDPDCTYLVHHNYRKDRRTEADVEEDGAAPLKLSDIEIRLYRDGPTGLLDLDNSVLYTGGEKDRLEKLVVVARFNVNEKIEKRNSKTVFDDIPALYTRYEHRKGVVSLQFFYSTERPFLSVNIRAREGTDLISYSKLLEEVRSGDAELEFSACILFNHYGSRPFKPNQSRFEDKKSLEVSMRDNSLPLLEAVLDKRLPALLKPKGTYPILLNLP